MMRILAACMVVFSAGLASATPTFTVKPHVSRAGQDMRIEFTVDQQTDVAVYIESADGKILRHLAAGVLGKNAPAPLKADSLAQSIAWDGRDDDGRPVANDAQAGLRVRVALGLTARYAGQAFSQNQGPNQLTSVLGLAAGPDGRIYVMDNRTGWLYWPAYSVHVFRRDGSYEQTIKPFPSNQPADRVKPAGAFINDRGLLNPIIHRTLGMTFYPYEDEPTAQMAVGNGRLFLTVVPSQAPPTSNPTYRGEATHIAAINLDGSIPEPGYAGPVLDKKLAFKGEAGVGGARLAVSSDGKSIYLVNIGTRYYDKKFKLRKHSVVYRAPLPEMGPATVFFGEVDKPGSDNAHLVEPMGVAVDGRGNLLIADRGSDRIVVLKESDASFVSSFPTSQPEWVAADRKSGAIYVANDDRLSKFAGIYDPRKLADADLGQFYKGLIGWRKDAQRLSFALDSSAEPAIAWVGLTMGDKTLLRCEDKGESFGPFIPADCYQPAKHWRPASDPTHSMVLCRIDTAQGFGMHLLDEAAGKSRVVRLEPGKGSNQGTQSRLDRDGNIYSSAAAGGIWKCDANGKFVPFPATADDPKLKGMIPAGSSGTTAWERDIYVDRKGDIYAKVRGASYHGLMHVAVYGPDGSHKRNAIVAVTDGGYGPRVDAAGNLYIMENVKPLNQPFPDEFKPHVTDRWVKHWYDWMYGSIVKFPPSGGNMYFSTRNPTDKPNADFLPLPETVARQPVYATFRKEASVQGALWITPGFAHCGDMSPAGGGGNFCHCTGCDFDTDDFGRTFAPDNGRQRVTVLDANGNVIVHFGGYGTQDNCGPDSYVLDEAGKFLRPRKADDPKDLVSPFASPEIAFSFIVGLAVTDRNAYVLDNLNRRVLRVKLDYAAEDVCQIK